MTHFHVRLRLFAVFTTLCLAFFAITPVIAQGTPVSFTGGATLTASRTDLDAEVFLELNASQSLYHVVLAAQGQGERREIARITQWRPGERKQFRFSLPSPHLYSGRYHLLLELVFQDQAGGHLSASMAFDYGVDEGVAQGSTGLNISQESIDWTVDGVDLARATFRTSSSPHWVLVMPVQPGQTDTVPLQPIPGSQPQPLWRYPQTAILSWITRGRHEGTTQRWSLYTDAEGAVAAQVSDELRNQAEAAAVTLTARSTQTAAPNRLGGEAQLEMDSPEALADVSISAITETETVEIARFPRWEPGERQSIRFDLPVSHGLPGRYHLLLDIQFSDEQGRRFSDQLPIEYEVEGAKQPLAEPQVTISGDQLRWDTDGLAPENVKLTVTSGPAWELAGGAVTARTGILPLQERGPDLSLPNRAYPQTARLEWIHNQRHQSVVFNWEIRTDRRGQILRDAAAPSQQVSDQRPWWRKPAILWTIGIAIAIFASIGALQQLLRRRHQ